VAFDVPTLARHQLSSAVATAVDFGTMALLVEKAGVLPGMATLVAASVGAVVNFTLNRRHTFEGARSGGMTGQALRYWLVSSASALFNAAGVHVGVRLLGGPYLLVRAAVAVSVGLGWNYPMHRLFVFRPAAEGRP
jgi:putative flippase GtrA